MSNGEKKSLSPLAWIGIGCGVVVLLVIVVLVVGGLFVAKKVKDVAGDFEANPELAAARMIVKLNPEWEEVSFDEEAGTITIRETESGKEMTVDLQDLKEGRVSFSSDEGTVSIGASGEGEEGQFTISSDQGSATFGAGQHAATPDWAPVYPGTEARTTFSMSGDDGVRGSFELETADDVDEVVAFFRERLKADGFEVSVNTYAADGGTQGAMVMSEDAAGKRTVHVAVNRDGEVSRVTVTYSTES